jgi:hypothetical protein
MNEQRKELNYLEMVEKVKELIGIEKRYYDYLPEECWKTEATQAKELKISRSKLKGLKNRLIKAGIISLELQPNGKRKNLKHKLTKLIPIILREREQDYSRYSLEEDDYSYFINNINWSLLQNHTAADLNKMSRLEMVKLYMDCGFIVLPAHYPIFESDGVRCSCSKGASCAHIGKHPIHRYKYIDSLNYEYFKQSYLEEFEKNPELNIGFKVMGFSVLDIDNRHNGHKTLEKLTREYEINLNHVLSVTCSNGSHIYANNTQLKNTAGAISDGIDVRSDGGFIIAPDSIHKSGTRYQWNEIGDVATIPSEWLETEDEENSDSVKYKSGVNTSAANKLKDIKLPAVLTSDYVIKDGERELTLFKWACRERGKGANAEQIYDILITIRDTYCEDGEEPVTDTEIRDIANSVVSQYSTNYEKQQLALNP